MAKKQLMIKALDALYTEVPESVAESVTANVMSAYNELLDALEIILYHFPKDVLEDQLGEDMEKIENALEEIE